MALQNFAEECLQAHAMLLPDGNPYVRTIISDDTNLPNIILYGQEMIQFINTFCGSRSKQPVILSVDRTYNLGHAFGWTFVLN